MKQKHLTGIILAAGFGSRLAGSSTQTRLKPLTPVAGEPLIVRTLDSLALAGCRTAVIVLGHASADIQQSIEHIYQGPLALEFVVNPHFEKQNGLSLMTAGTVVQDSFLLTMADHVFSDEVMQLASQHEPPPNGATLVVDYRINEIFDLDDATKVLAGSDNRVIQIGKQIPKYNCIDTGLFIGTRAMIDEATRLFDTFDDASLSQVVQALAKNDCMKVLDIGTGFWQDVDTPQMLRHAESVLGR